MLDLPSDATVLVTGANGFVGTRICRHLTDGGVAVRALVRRSDADLSEAGDVEVAISDLDDPVALADAMSDVTHVVHCAAVAGPDMESAAAVNVFGTRSVLAAAREAGVERVVHVSTTSVVSPDALVVDDRAARVDDDAGPYSVTKRDAEDVVAEAAEAGLATVVLRPPAVLGWGPTSTWGQRFPEWVDTGELPFRPDRRAHLGWVHVDDFAAAVGLALTSDAAVGRLFTVANGTTTWEAYLGTVASWFPEAEDPFEDGDEAPPPRSWSADGIRDALGWTPTHSFEDAMEEIAAHHRG